MLDLSNMVPVAPGLSGLSCTCGRAFTRFEASGLHKMPQCPQCGMDIRREELNLEPTSEALSMLDDAEVKRVTWFHITRRRDWHSGVLAAETPVHVGTKVAALTRAHGLRSGKPVDSLWWLQEVEIAKNASFLPGLAEDDAKGEPILDLDELEEVAGDHDGLRYLNLYEDAGSVSLLVDPAFVRIVSTTAISHRALAQHLQAALDESAH